MPVNFELPPSLRHDHDAVYTAAQLAPTIARLRAAVADLGEGAPTPAGLAAAWTRAAELRLPRKAVPAQVLDEVEALAVAWSAHGMGGIARRAWALAPEERTREGERLRAMLAATEAAAADAPVHPLYPSE